MERLSTAMEVEYQNEAAEGGEESAPEAGAAFQSLDIRSVRMNRIMSLIFTCVVCVGFAIATLIVTLSLGGFGWIPMLVAGAGIVLTLFFLWLTAVWPRLEYERTTWCLDEKGLQIRRGVIWRHHVSVPIARVQHADVSQGPMQRQFGLGKLTVHTAGTQNASVALDGLSHETAIDLRDKLIAQRRSGHVV